MGEYVTLSRRFSSRFYFILLWSYRSTYCCLHYYFSIDLTFFFFSLSLSLVFALLSFSFNNHNLLVAVKTANGERMYVCAVFYAAQKNLSSIQRRLVFYSNEATAKCDENQKFSLLDYMCWSEWFAKTKQNENGQNQQKRATLIHTHGTAQRICIARHARTQAHTSHRDKRKSSHTNFFLRRFSFSRYCCDHKSFSFFIRSLFIHWNVRDFVIVCKPNKKPLIIALLLLCALGAFWNTCKKLFFIGRFFAGGVRGGPNEALSLLSSWSSSNLFN